MSKIIKIGKRTFASLKIRNYRLFFIGQSISLIGTWMQTIGQGILVLQITGSGTILGTVIALQFLPILILGPFGGVIADRFPKRNMLYITQTLAGLLALLFGFLVITHEIKIWMVELLALSLGLVNTIDNPVRQSFISELVGRENLSNAVSLNSSIANVARVIGPAIAGILILTIGIAMCFIVNGISYIAVLIVLSFMKKEEFLLVQKKIIGSSIQTLKEGFVYVKSSPVLLTVLLMMTLIGMLSYEFSVLLPLYSQFTFHGNAGTYAALTGAMGFGAVIGGLFAASRKKITPQMVVTAALFFGIAILIASVAPSLPYALSAMVMVGICSVNFMSLANSNLQIASKPEMRGRVMSLWTVAFLGTTPIGSPIIGWISQYQGPRMGFIVGGVAALLAAWYGHRALKKMTAHAFPSGEMLPIAELEVEKISQIR